MSESAPAKPFRVAYDDAPQPAFKGAVAAIGNFALAWQASDGAVRLCRADLSGKEFAALECTDWVR